MREAFAWRALRTFSLIRTVTVGSGIAPDLLTPSKPKGARGLAATRRIPPVGTFTPP